MNEDLFPMELCWTRDMPSRPGDDFDLNRVLFGTDVDEKSEPEGNGARARRES